MLVGNLGGLFVAPPTLGTSGAPPFSPTSISGCILYLNAGLGVTTVSSKVSVWADQSGNGNDAVQASSAARVNYSASVAELNGLPGSGTTTNDGTMDVENTTMNWGTSFTLCTGYVRHAISSFGIQLAFAFESGSGAGGALRYVGPVAGFHQAYNGALMQGPAIVDGTPVVSTYTQDGSGGTLYINGSSVASNANTVSALTGGYSVCGDALRTLPLCGEIAFVVAYDHVLNGTDRGNLETWMKGLLGL